MQIITLVWNHFIVIFASSSLSFSNSAAVSSLNLCLLGGFSYLTLHSGHFFNLGQQVEQIKCISLHAKMGMVAVSRQTGHSRTFSFSLIFAWRKVTTSNLGSLTPWSKMFELTSFDFFSLSWPFRFSIFFSSICSEMHRFSWNHFVGSISILVDIVICCKCRHRRYVISTIWSYFEMELLLLQYVDLLPYYNFHQHKSRLSNKLLRL